MQERESSLSARVAVLAYGMVAYAMFLVAFLYAIGFVGNLVVPKSIDMGTPGPLGASILINVLLLGAFAVQHTIMARPWFKARWTRIIPQAAERSTFVLVTSLLLLFIFWQWRPMPQVMWTVDHPVARVVLYGLFAGGFGLVLYASFLIDHFELFGLKQVYMHWRGRTVSHPEFVTPRLYRIVRNPLMLGFLIAFWSTPVMTQGHLLFALTVTGYIFMGIQFEERDIARILGEPYREYRRVTPMLIPSPLRMLGERETPPASQPEL